jgi:GT2 family glycosyltransferase
MATPNRQRQSNRLVSCATLLGRPPIQENPRSEPSISVVVCSHNGERTLPGLLASLRGQSLSSERYEVTVVDDGSTDRTAAVAEASGVRVMRLAQNAGLAAARNAGVSAASAAIVAFTDDDCEADRDWLIALLAAFEDRDVAGIGGRVVPDPSGGFVPRYLARRTPLAPLKADLLISNNRLYRLGLYVRATALGETEPRKGEPLYSVVGANMAFRRQLILDLDGFDESFAFGFEEEDFCKRLLALGKRGRLLYEPSAVVVHRFERRLSATLRRSRTYGRGLARAGIKHQDLRLIVYPLPVTVLISVVSGLLLSDKRLLMVGALGPLAGYPRWLFDLCEGKSPEPLAYPYVQLAQEISTMLGEVDGRRAGYEPVPSKHLQAQD